MVVHMQMPRCLILQAIASFIFLSINGVYSLPVVDRIRHVYAPTAKRRPLLALIPNDWDDSNINNSVGNTAKDVETLRQIREQQLRDAVLESLFLSDDPPSGSSSSFLSLFLSGQAKLPLASTETGYNKEKINRFESRKKASTKVIVVTQIEDEIPYKYSDGDEVESTPKPTPVLFLPLPPPIDSRLQLLSQVYAAQPISSFTNMLKWNLNLINRDGSLFDNIPWNQWSKDPDRKNRDAAGNLVDEKFRYGKRDAYNRFNGKDVNSKTVAASKRRYWEKKLMSSLVKEPGDDHITDNEDDDDDYFDFDFSLSFLSKRVLELRIQELRMEIAEVDSQLAISRTANSENQQDLNDSRVELVESLEEAETNLNDLLSSLSPSSSSSSTTKKDEGINILDRIARWTVRMSTITGTEQKEAPYRGATGYSPRLSDDDDDAYVELYRSPFDLLNEILSDQLNAEVFECVLENTSWLEGTIVLGGAVVLRRRTPTLETKIMGETIRTPDREEDFGNFVKGGDLFVVECDVDEAIGVALSCDLPIRVERTIFERSSLMGIQVEPKEGCKNSDSEVKKPMNIYKNIREILPYWKALDSGISLDMEGDSFNPRTTRLSPISIPRTTSSLFDAIFEPSSNNADNMSSSSMFPTDNPIKSINQWDSLGNKEKAKTLLEMSNFSGRLPRPRAVRNAPANMNPLDILLLPLIDESVRREYNIREADRRGDTTLANQLRGKKSNRQKAKEKVDAAMRDGKKDLAEKWESEAEFLEGLRADITQDEGSYSRFLDRDDWYERDRQRTAKRAKRSSFGNLLDGIE